VTRHDRPDPAAGGDATPPQDAGAEGTGPHAKSGEGAGSALAAMKRRMQAEALHEPVPDTGSPTG
jgi:hypothetical protein